MIILCSDYMINRISSTCSSRYPKVIGSSMRMHAVHVVMSSQDTIKREKMKGMLVNLRRKFNDVANITAAETAGADPRPLIVDVRTPEEREVSYIPGEARTIVTLLMDVHRKETVEHRPASRGGMSGVFVAQAALPLTTGHAVFSHSSSGSMTVEEFETMCSQEKLDRDQKVVACCTIGYRSSQYARKLRHEGFNAYNLEGGILGWTHERLPLVAICPGNEFEECETKKVHVFGEQWSLQPDGYEPVVFRYPMLSYAASSIKSFFGG